MPNKAGIGTAVSESLDRDESHFIDEWIECIRNSVISSVSLADVELREQCRMFYRSFLKGFDVEGSNHFESSGWNDLRELLTEISRSRAVQGFTPTETARFVLSFKKPLFRKLREEVKESETFSDQIWSASELLDNFGLFTTEVFLKTREDVIRRTQDDILELSTPVIKLWKHVVALPLVGTLDSARTEVVTETLLDAIVRLDARVAIIDITGVPTVDTMVAQHLLKTVAAARLMGAECIISGIRPQIAQTIVHLGINLSDVTTKATLRDALAVALEKTGQQFGTSNSL